MRECIGVFFVDSRVPFGVAAELFYFFFNFVGVVRRGGAAFGEETQSTCESK